MCVCIAFKNKSHLYICNYTELKMKINDAIACELNMSKFSVVLTDDYQAIVMQFLKQRIF